MLLIITKSEIILSTLIVNNTEVIIPIWEQPSEAGMIVLGIVLTSWVVTKIYKNGIVKYYQEFSHAKFWDRIRRRKKSGS